MKKVILTLVNVGAIFVTALQQPSQPLGNKITSRRVFLASSSIIPAGAVLFPLSAAHASSSSLFADLLGQIRQAETQLDKVPALIEGEKWDAVRAILIESPLADCWAKTNRPLVTRYAEELGNLGGDELAALEAREELQGHLRYLDMSVYNNVFNPITVEGKSGATKELVRSYYEDPVDEFKASKAALQALIALSEET